MFNIIFTIAVIVAEPSMHCQVVDRNFALCEVVDSQGDVLDTFLCTWTSEGVNCGNQESGSSE